MPSCRFVFVTTFLVAAIGFTKLVDGQASEAAQTCKPVEMLLVSCERSVAALGAEIASCGAEKTTLKQDHDELVGDCQSATKKWEVALEEAKKQRAEAEANVVAMQSKMATADTSCKSVENEKRALAARADALAQQLKDLESKRLEIDVEFKSFQDTCAEMSKQVKDKAATTETQLVVITGKLESEVARNAQLAGDYAKKTVENDVLTNRLSTLMQEQQQAQASVKQLEDYRYLFSAAQAKRLAVGMYNLTKVSYLVAMNSIVDNTPDEVKVSSKKHWSTVRRSISDLTAKHFSPTYLVMKRRLSSSVVTTSKSAFYDHVWPLMETHGANSYASKLWEKASDFQEDFMNVASQLSTQLNTHVDDKIVSRMTSAAPHIGSMIPPLLMDRVALLLAWVVFSIIQKTLLAKSLRCAWCLLKTVARTLVCALTCGKCARRDMHKRRHPKLKPKAKHVLHKPPPTSKTEVQKVSVKADSHRDVKRMPAKK